MEKIASVKFGFGRSLLLFSNLYILPFFQYFDDKKALLSAFTLGQFTLFYFFAFMYYTDVGSTFMVLLMYCLHLDGNDWFASFIGALSVLFRQTNVVWVFFVAIQAIVPLLVHAAHEAQMEAKHGLIKFSLTTFGQTMDLLKGLYFLLFTPFNFLKLLFLVLKTCLGYLTVGLSFVVFVYWNNGVVVGDKSAHQVMMHLTQVLYFCAFCLFFSAPYAISRIEPFFNAVKRHFIFIGLAMLMIIGIIKSFTVAHPYLLADNR